jgi:CRP-like cAMP-binding protein
VELQVLAGLPESTRQRLLQRARRRRLGRGEVIFHEGDEANAMHVLLAGHATVRTTTPHGDSVIVTMLGPGSVFGELALLSDKALRTATVTAVEAVDTLTFLRRDLDELRQTDPEMDRFLLDTLVNYVRRQDARLIEALYVPVEKRVLRRLLALARLYGGPAVGTVVPLTQEMLAGMAGSTRPTTNQVLRAAEQAGLLRLARGSIRICDPAGLVRRSR